MLSFVVRNRKLQAASKPLPTLRRGWALIRVRRAGICNTDVEILRGYHDFHGTPGHEFVGEVAEVEGVNAATRKKWLGNRVAGEINVTCSAYGYRPLCDFCRRGLKTHCARRTVLGIVAQDGAFGEYLALPLENLHVVPESVSDEKAVFIEPLAAACEILDQVSIPPNSPVAVLGDGKLGILIALVLRANGYPVRHFGKHVEKLRISGAKFSTDPPPAAAFDWVVDATGHPDGLRAAVAAARPRGTLILKPTVHGTVPVDTAPIIVNEITLIGSRCGRFEASLPLLDHGVVKVEPLIADRFPLAEAPRAFARAAERGVLKVLLTGTA